MDAQASVLVFAAVMFISVAAFGYIPLTLELSSNNLKKLTAIGAGVLIASAFLVVIPEALELFEDHEDDDSKIAGLIALVILEVDRGDISADQAIEEIETLVGGHDGHGHEDSHSEESTEDLLSELVLHVIEEVEEDEINATAGLEEIEELISDTSHSHDEEGHIEPSTLGLAILFGFVLMLLLETFGLPHAIHHDEDKDLLGLSATIGLIAHAAADGLAVGASVSSSAETGLIVFVAIMLHKGPAAFGLSSFLKHIKIEDSKAKMYLILFALSSPVVAVLTFFALKDTSFATDDNIGLTLLFSAGTFIYVATVDVLPEVHSHDHNHDDPVWFVVLGVFLVFLTTLIGHVH
ncbi:MAG TPA: ZIP family metal transporter [Candidatus Poseidoniia archaeon]|jgi:zinc transporter 9|nr:ZIP family metal transporter [Candidatus Poseidoniia archaeon]|tara:strand:+ start:5072 stop:6124 length:1053 start_codon:yes stop_codon:yes gene_type:complete